MSRFTDAVEKVRSLPEDRQELAAEILMNLVSGEAFDIALDAEQVAEIGLAKSEAEAGDFATDEAVSALWNKHIG